METGSRKRTKVGPVIKESQTRSPVVLGDGDKDWHPETRLQSLDETVEKGRIWTEGCHCRVRWVQIVLDWEVKMVLNYLTQHCREEKTSHYKKYDEGSMVRYPWTILPEVPKDHIFPYVSVCLFFTRRRVSSPYNFPVNFRRGFSLYFFPNKVKSF